MRLAARYLLTRCNHRHYMKEHALFDNPHIVLDNVAPTPDGRLCRVSLRRSGGRQA